MSPEQAREIQSAIEAQRRNPDRSICRLDAADGLRCMLLPGHQCSCVSRPREIIIERDFDGYFEALVRSWLARVPNPKHMNFLVTAGPYRADALTYTSTGDTIRLDFYSGLRFYPERLSARDVAKILEIL